MLGTVASTAASFGDVWCSGWQPLVTGVWGSESASGGAGSGAFGGAGLVCRSLVGVATWRCKSHAGAGACSGAVSMWGVCAVGWVSHMLDVASLPRADATPK